MCLTRQAMTRLVAILVTLFLVAIPAKADVALWPRPVPGWTVIQVYGVIKPDDLATFQPTRKTSIRQQPWLLSPARAATSRLASAWVYAFTRRS